MISSEYESRPFSSMEEMDKYMIDMWNSVVSPEDRVIYGGDFTLSSKRQYHKLVSNWLIQLHGTKILVKGNHDRSRNKMVELGFESAHLYYVENNILVVHHLRESWHRIRHLIDEVDYVLYGHVHNRIIEEVHGVNVNNEKFINICVEPLQYIPHTIEQLIELRKQQLEVQNV